MSKKPDDCDVPDVKTHNENHSKNSLSKYSQRESRTIVQRIFQIRIINKLTHKNKSKKYMIKSNDGKRIHFEPIGHEDFTNDVMRSETGFNQDRSPK